MPNFWPLVHFFDKMTHTVRLSTHRALYSTDRTIYFQMLMTTVVALLLGAMALGGAHGALSDRVDDLEDKLNLVAEQLMMNQFYMEERARSSYGSGVKNLRNIEVGSRSYLGGSFADQAVMAIHNHANNIRTLGFGEMCVVLNGVEFKTRHNDYRMYQKSTSTKDYGATENIAFPDVPPEVTGSVSNQIKEMREYFRAFALQDRDIRDYRKYFPPVLCYLEGAWTISDADKIEESFESDRHFLDAYSWRDLAQKVRFNAKTGHKDTAENFAMLPTTIYHVDNKTGPQIAQWNFRILCHKLRKDLRLDRFRVVNDIQNRMRKPGGLSLEELKATRWARFDLRLFNTGDWQEDGGRKYRMVDEMMEEVPGYDNYPGFLKDEAYGQENSRFDNDRLNAAYYHRWYSTKEKGANGLNINARGYADQNLYMALNTRKQVAPISVTSCPKDVCTTYTQRISYAIPLEIVYLTPLSNWNPYKIKYRGDRLTDEGKKIFFNGDDRIRDGSCTRKKAYDGTNSKFYYRTPYEFFSGSGDSGDADTTEDFVCVLDRNGDYQKVSASGHRITLPEIQGVGVIRQRYPIAKIIEEDNTIWKEIDAMKDYLQRPKEYPKVAMTYHSQSYYTGPYRPDSNDMHQRLLLVLEKRFKDGDYPSEITMHTMDSTMTETEPPHHHEFKIPKSDMKELVNEETLSYTTSKVNGHAHSIKIARYVDTKSDGSKSYSWRLKECDDVKSECPDGHGKRIYIWDF